MRINKILIPINYSDCANNAIKYAGNLAKEFHAKILILHALNNSNVATTEEIEKEKAKHVEKINNIIENEPSLSLVMAEPLVSEESPKEAILWATEAFDIDLIIIGTEGIHKPYLELVGSFTYHVISESNLPVLTIPDSCPYVKPHKIGFGVDYKLMDPKSVLDLVKHFTEVFKSKLEIFHVKTFGSKPEPDEVQQSQALDDFFANINHSFKTLEKQSIPDGLKDYADQYEPNLIVIMPRKYKFFEWLKHDSVTQQVVQHLQLPILTIPETI